MGGLKSSFSKTRQHPKVCLNLVVRCDLNTSGNGPNIHRNPVWWPLTAEGGLVTPVQVADSVYKRQAAYNPVSFHVGRSIVRIGKVTVPID